MFRFRNISNARRRLPPATNRHRHHHPAKWTREGAGTRLLLVVLVSVGIFTGVSTAWAVEAVPLTGKPLQARLERRVSLTLRGRELLAAINSLASQQQVAILLDRRIDPSQKIDVTIRDLPLRAAFRQLAKQAKISTSQLGPVTYFGPRETARQLRTLAQLRRNDFAKLSAERRRELQQRSSLTWSTLATPQEILSQVDEHFDLTGVKLKAIPHDLWSASSLPPLDLADQLTLLLAGFNKTFKLDKKGQRWRPVPLPKTIALDERYPGGHDIESRVQRLQQLAPNANIQAAGKRIEVSGTVEEHERIAASLRRAKRGSRDPVPNTPTAENGAPKKTDTDKQRITLRVAEARLQSLLSAVEKQLDLEITLDESVANSGTSTDQRVSVDVTDATLDEFLTQVLDGTGLTYQRQGSAVTIRAAR